MDQFISELSKAIGKKLYSSPGENFHNSASTGFGIRYFIEGSLNAFRLNFNSENSTDLAKLLSIDIWDGSSRDPITHIDIDGDKSRIDQVIPQLAKIINNPKDRNIDTQLSESEGELSLNVSNGGTHETYKTDAENQFSEDEKRTYKESLVDLKSLVIGLVKGVSNFLFVYGRGGGGKTTAIESTLNAMGLYDGDGYFQISGNISSAVAYEALYNNKNGIVLFDDCNSVLDDEAGRAIIKTATDTKKVRKLSYLKRSSRFFDPTKENPPEELIGIEKFPRSFNFEGRIIFISNLTIDDLDPDRSIRTRVLRIDISPTDSELIDFMESILDKIELNDGLTLSHEKRLECLNIVKNSKRKDDLSIRKLVRTMNLAASGIPGWQQLALLYA
jgi:hypothetical protein